MQRKSYLFLVVLLIAQSLFSVSQKLEICFYNDRNDADRTGIIEQFMQKAISDTVFQVSEDDYAEGYEYYIGNSELYIFIKTSKIQETALSTSSLISSASIFCYGKYIDTVINTSRTGDYQSHSNNIYNLLSDKNSDLYNYIFMDRIKQSREAINSELENYASHVIHFWKTPISQGGAGEHVSEVIPENVSMFIGFYNSYPPKATDNHTLTTDNGDFRVMLCAGNIVVLKGIGCVPDRDGNYQIETVTIELYSLDIKHEESTGKSF